MMYACPFMNDAAKNYPGPRQMAMTVYSSTIASAASQFRRNARNQSAMRR